MFCLTSMSPAGLPRTRTSPALGKIRPSRVLMVVVFPGAVGPEEAEDLALVHIQADVVDSDDAAVLFDEMVDLNRLRVARIGVGGRRGGHSRAGRR